MGVWRFTLITDYKGFGDSETLWTPNITAPAAVPIINRWLRARVAIMPTTVTIQGLRIAEDTGLRHSQLLIPGSSYWADAALSMNLASEGGFPLGKNEDGPSQWRAILQYRLNFGTNQKAIRYLSGFPDAIATTEPGGINRAGNNAWWSLFTTWLNVMENGSYYIKSLVKPANPLLWQPTGIYQIPAVSTDLLLGFNTPTFPGLAVGQRIHAYNFRPAKGTRAPTLNGTWYVSVVNTTQMAGTTLIGLRNSSTINPALQRFTDKTFVFPVSYQYSAITNSWPIRLGIRKRGKDSLVPRGRRLTRATLDP